MGIDCLNCRHVKRAGAGRRPTGIDRLPDEVLLMILERLPSGELVGGAGRVSRRWALLVRRCVARVTCRAQLRRLPRSPRALIVAPPARFSVPVVMNSAARLRLLRELCCHAGVRFGDADVAALAGLPHLQHLDVFTACAARDVSDSAVADRLSSLVVNSYTARLPGAERCRLRALHMYGEALFAPPVRLLALLTARRDHLTELTLRCADLRGAVYEAIGACANLASLQLYSCWLMSAEDFGLATRPAGLRRLHVTGAVMVRRSSLSGCLAALPGGVEELALSGSAFGDEHAAALAARLPGLRVLELWRARLSPDGALRLAGALGSLRVLDLDLPLRAAHVAALRRHPALQYIRCLGERPAGARGRLRRRPAGDVGVELPEGLRDQRAPAGDEGVELPEGLRGPRRAVRVGCAAARFAEDTFRRRGEGFRAKVFYHWAPARLLRPLPRGCRGC